MVQFVFNHTSEELIGGKRKVLLLEEMRFSMIHRLSTIESCRCKFNKGTSKEQVLLLTELSKFQILTYASSGKGPLWPMSFM